MCICNSRFFFICIQEWFNKKTTTNILFYWGCRSGWSRSWTIGQMANWLNKGSGFIRKVEQLGKKRQQYLGQSSRVHSLTNRFLSFTLTTCPRDFYPFPSYPFSYTVLPPSTPQICTDYLTIGALATEWAQLLITQLTVASPTTHQGSRRNDGAELVNVIASKGQPGHDIQEQLFLMDPTACPINLKWSVITAA